MTDKSFTAEEVRNNVAENRRYMRTETEAQLLEFAAMLEQREAVTDETCRLLLSKLPLSAAGTPIDMVRDAINVAGLSRHARQVPDDE